MNLHVITVPYRYDEFMSGLGAGPRALLDAGLEGSIEQSGHHVRTRTVATLDDSERESGRTAVNIGKLGASTASLVAAAAKDDSRMIVLTGDDTAVIGIVSGLQEAYGAGARIGVVWVDAHGDFNTPDTSYSGILAGMSLAILAGLAGPNWRAAAKLAAPISTDRIIIAGIRDLDQQEEDLLNATDVQRVSTEDLRNNPESLTRALEILLKRVDLIALHLDVDVLDPVLAPSAITPNPDGLTIETAAWTLRTILATGVVQSVSVCGVNPGGGARGSKSVESVVTLMERSLPAWT